jgi:hypothetical protein
MANIIKLLKSGSFTKHNLDFQALLEAKILVGVKGKVTTSHYLHLVGDSKRIPKNPNSKRIQSHFVGVLINGFIITYDYEICKEKCFTFVNANI